MAGCGGESGQSRALDHFDAYSAAEVDRSEAEENLNRAFREISRAARTRDREAVVAAARRGQEAAAVIRESLGVEIGAAEGLAGYEPTTGDGQRLGRALRQSREGLSRIERQLEIATRDPFLDEPRNAEAISRLSRESIRLSVSAAFARRDAAHAIALTLGVDPPFDSRFDLETTPGS